MRDSLYYTLLGFTSAVLICMVILVYNPTPRIKKPVTRAFYQVTGMKDGIMVRTIQKGHPRASHDESYDTAMWRFPVNLNNILDVASDRDEMITKREMIK